MWYMILGRDAPNSLGGRRENRPAHIERVQALHAAGRILAVGPLAAIDSSDPGPAGFVGSLIIAEFPSLADARAWAEADPYRTAGVWAGVEVHPYIKVF